MPWYSGLLPQPVRAQLNFAAELDAEFKDFSLEHPSETFRAFITGRSDEESATKILARNAGDWYGANPYVKRAIDLQAEALTQATWALYRDAAKKNRITNHPALDALNTPNPFQSRAWFIQAMFSWLKVWGNVYVYNAGTTSAPELYILPADKVTIIPDTRGWPALYLLKLPMGRYMRYELDEVTHIKRFSMTSTLQGQGDISALLEDLQIGALARRTRKTFWKNDARPGGILSSKDPLSDQDANTQAKRWKNTFGGPDKAGKIAVLSNGLLYQAVGAPPKDTEWLSQHDVEAKDVTVAVGTPLVLMDGSASTYATAREATKTMWHLGILSIASLICGGLSAAPWAGGLFLDFDTSDIDALKSDEALEREDAIKKYMAGLITLNRAKELIGEKTIPTGDVYLLPSNRVFIAPADIGAKPEPAPEPAPPAGDPDDDETPDTTGGDSDAAPAAQDGKAIGAGAAHASAAGPHAPTDPAAHALAHVPAGVAQSGSNLRASVEPLSGADAGRVRALDDAGDTGADADPDDSPLEVATLAWGSTEHKSVWERKAAVGTKPTERLAKQLKSDFRAQKQDLLVSIRLEDGDDDASVVVDPELMRAHATDTITVHIREIAEAAADDLLEQLNIDDDGEKDAGLILGTALGVIGRWATGRSTTLAAQLLDTTIAAVVRLNARSAADGWSVEQMQAGITELFDGYDQRRADNVAGDMRTAASSEGQQATAEAAIADGYTLRKRWVTELDDTVRADHKEAHGQEVDADDFFIVGGLETHGPGECDDPAQDANCRCVADFYEA